MDRELIHSEAEKFWGWDWYTKGLGLGGSFGGGGGDFGISPESSLWILKNKYTEKYQINTQKNIKKIVRKKNN